MEKIKQFIQDPAWWFTLIIGGILLSMLGNYLVHIIDRELAVSFKSYRLRRNKQKHNYELDVTEIAIDDLKYIQFNVDYVTQMLKFFIVIILLFVYIGYGNINPESAIMRLFSLFLIQLLIIITFYLLYCILKTLNISNLASKIRGSLLLYDDFKVYKGWENYLSGGLALNPNFSYRGDFSLEKLGNPDPNGGYKELTKPAKLGILFSGSIYSPSERGNGTTGFADRLAVEDEKFNGYGFAVAHGINRLIIERRDGGNPQDLAYVDFEPPREQWYHFQFYMRSSSRFDLEIYDSSLNLIADVRDIQDRTYNLFDRVVIHGGFPYYVGYLKVEKIEE